MEYICDGNERNQYKDCLLYTSECDADQRYKEAYLKAGKEDIVIVKSPVGMPGRAILNPFMKRVIAGEKISHSCHGCLHGCQPCLLYTSRCV